MADPPALHVTTRSGHVRVAAVVGATLEVSGGTTETQDDGSIRIRRAPDADTIEVRCAAGSDVTIGTVSGRVDVSGDPGAVRVATVSGSIRIERAARVDVRSKSGSVEIGQCADDCRIMTTSSKVNVGTAARATVAAVSGVVVLGRVGRAEVKSVSAKVWLALASDAVRVSVHSVSGKVEVRVPPALKPATRLRSISGRVECDVTRGTDVEVAVASVSGAIRVSAA